MRRLRFAEHMDISSIIIILLALTFLFLAELSYAGQPNSVVQARSINWDELFQALKTVEKSPSDDSIKAFLDKIPEQFTEDQAGDEDKFLEAIDGSEVFEDLLVKGNPFMAEAAFRLMAFILPGAFYEDFFIRLGKLATGHPRLFLQMLKRYKSNFEYEYPVTMTEILDIVPDIVTEEDWVRRNREELRLYEERLKALKSVTDPELIGIRDECIKVIEEIIKEIKDRSKKIGTEAG